MTRRFLPLIALLIAASIAYGLTLDNGLQPHELHGGDLITHQYAQVQGRPSNAPGYPIYTMGGWLWFHSIREGLRAAGVEYPNPIPILSSYSTFWALIALGFLYQVIIETTKTPERASGNRPVAILVTAFYAATYFFWYYATTTEQYSSAIAHTLAILYAFILWGREPDNLRRLYVLAFLCGLSLAHMLTVALIVPPIVAAVLWRRPQFVRSPRVFLWCVVAAALPLLSYVYVYVRGMQHPEWRGTGEWTSNASWFLAFVSTAQGREELLWGFEPGRSFFGNGYPALIVQELGWLMLGAGLLGIASLRRPLPAVLYTTLGLYALFTWAYRYGNWFQVILPAYPLLLVGAGAAANWVQGLSPPTRSTNSRPFTMAIQLVPLLALTAALAWRIEASLPAADSRNRPEDTALQRAAVLIDQPLPEGAALFAPVDDALALQYLTSIWQLRPDLRVVSSKEASQALRQSPIFVTWDAAQTLLSELETAARPAIQAFSPDWLALIGDTEIGRSAWVTSGPTHVVGQRITNGLILAGYSVTASPSGLPVNRNAPSSVDITLFWQMAVGQWPSDLRISVRPTYGGEFLMVDGTMVQEDRAQPANGLAPTAPQAQSAVVPDPYRLPAQHVDAGRPDGVAVIVYRQVGDGFEDVARVDLPLPEQ